MIHSHTPDVSIIVPVYNVEKKLSRCVDSLLQQTFSNIEIILVDDGSSDGSGILCDTYSKQDSRITVIHKENGGVSSARNAGIDVAQGNYLMFCDSDDFVHASWVEILHSMIVDKNINLGVCYMTRQLDTLHAMANDNSKFILSSSDYLTLFQKGLALSVCNKIFRLEVIRNNSILFDNSLTFAEDAVFIMQYIRLGKGNISITNRILYYYTRENSESLSRKYIDNFWAQRKRGMSELKMLLQECCCGLPTMYYTDYIYTIVCALNNIQHKNNPTSFINKYKEGIGILHSSECKEAFKYGCFKEYHPIYTTILKTRCYFFVLMFHYLIKIKHKLWGERDL